MRVYIECSQEEAAALDREVARRFMLQSMTPYLDALFEKRKEARGDERVYVDFDVDDALLLHYGTWRELSKNQ